MLFFRSHFRESGNPELSNFMDARLRASIIVIPEESF